jgi:hypothetical protein
MAWRQIPDLLRGRVLSSLFESGDDTDRRLAPKRGDGMRAWIRCLGRKGVSRTPGEAAVSSDRS